MDIFIARRRSLCDDIRYGGYGEGDVWLQRRMDH